jgi:hypothetical protein
LDLINSAVWLAIAVAKRIWLDDRKPVIGVDWALHHFSRVADGPKMSGRQDESRYLAEGFWLDAKLAKTGVRI